MKNDKPKSEERAGIRKQAEKVSEGKTTDLKKLSSGDIQSLVHELEVHQIELEMQNEELQRVQNELEEARNMYSDLYDFAPLGYFTFDRNGLILEVNLTAANKLGIERASLIKKPFSLYIAPDHKDTFYSHLRQVFDTVTQMTCELRLVNINIKGHQFDALLESMPIHDLDGNLLCRTAISDITDRKRAEEVSQEARRYAENIIETIREPFVVLDIDLKILSANHSFYSTFEVTPDETVGNLIYDIGNRQWDIPSLRTLLEEILPKNTQFLNYEVSHTFQTIGQKIMLLNARQIYQEVIGTPIILLAIEDITERKRAEKVSQEARRYAENIIETIRKPFVVLDKDLKILSANHSFYSTFEVTPDETVGNLIYDIGNRQWDIPSLRTLLEEILPKNTQFLNYEVSHTFQTIGQKIMLLNARQIHQEVIGIQIILLAIEDITERKRAEETLKIYAEKLEEANRLKDLFTDIMRHDLLNPLSVIKGATEQILLMETMDEKMPNMLHMIQRNADKLIDMIESASMYAILESTEKLERKSLDLNEIFMAVADNFKLQMEEKNMKLEYISNGECSIMANPMIEAIFSNLLGNAIKYSPAGGKLEVGIIDERENYKIYFKDWGYGIKDEDKSKLFTRFQRVERKGVKGSGLGLAIVKRVVDLHGGKIYLESKDGIGSTFTILLPIEAKKE